MRQTNYVVVLGYVVKEPEFVGKDSNFAWFVIVNKRDDKRNFLLCKLFHPLVKLAKNIKKGRRVIVEGHIEQYEKNYTITVERIQFFSEKSKESEQQSDDLIQTPDQPDVF